MSAQKRLTIVATDNYEQNQQGHNQDLILDQIDAFDSPERTPRTTRTTATTPGTHHSGASLHFDALYPDIIEEGENIDYYLPEIAKDPAQDDGHNTSTSFNMSMVDANNNMSMVYLQDVYQTVRSPVYSGRAPFFVAPLTPAEVDTSVVRRENESSIVSSATATPKLVHDSYKLDVSQNLSISYTHDHDDRAELKKAANTSSSSETIHDNLITSDGTSTSYNFIYDSNGNENNVSNRSTPTDVTVYSTSTDGILDAVYQALDQYALSLQSHCYRQTLVSCAASVDQWMERHFPEEVVRALLLPGIVPVWMSEIFVIGPRSLLVLVAYLSHKSKMLGVWTGRWYLWSVLWPLRKVEAIVRYVLIMTLWKWYSKAFCSQKSSHSNSSHSNSSHNNSHSHRNSLARSTLLRIHE